MYFHIYVYKYLCVCIHVYVCVFICMWVYAYVYMDISIYIFVLCTLLCSYVGRNIYINIYIYIYIYICIYMVWRCYGPFHTSIWLTEIKIFCLLNLCIFLSQKTKIIIDFAKKKNIYIYIYIYLICWFQWFIYFVSHPLYAMMRFIMLNKCELKKIKHIYI